MTIEKNNLNAAILSYIKENNLLEGFDKLEVFDTYTFIKKEKPFDTEHLDETIISYIYHQKRTYRFKIGNSECDIDIDCGNFSIPEQTYGNDVYKLEWDDKSEINLQDYEFVNQELKAFLPLFKYLKPIPINKTHSA